MTTHQLHHLPTEGVDKHISTSPKSGQNIVQNLYPEFLSHCHKQWEHSLMMLTRNQETWPIISSFKLQ